MEKISKKQWSLFFINLSLNQSDRVLKDMYNELSGDGEEIRKNVISSKSLDFELTERQKLSLAVFDKCGLKATLKDFKTIKIKGREFDLSEPIKSEIEDKLKLIDMLASNCFPSHSEVLFRETGIPSLEKLILGHTVELNNKDLTIKFGGNKLLFLEKGKPLESDKFGSADLSEINTLKDVIVNEIAMYQKFVREHSEAFMPSPAS